MEELLKRFVANNVVIYAVGVIMTLEVSHAKVLRTYSPIMKSSSRGSAIVMSSASSCAGVKQ